MFKKILIANRGEIACRVARTARRLGVLTVAVYSDADAHAAHVQACDQAVHIGPAPASESYLQWQRILDAALSTGAQAIHPGYGFLSENADFARACAQAGLVFIGPPPEAMAAMGSKSAAKSLMEQAGVPLVPGYHGPNNDPACLAQEADRIGYPVLIKASAGGGGRGMRRVEQAQDFASALSSCQREAQASFGNAQVLIERYVTRPRHIEIQVFADTHGQCVHLFERDCSVQRRHQKVLEESPAPGLSAARRAEMGAAAVAAAKAVGYVGAGTVEFIAEPTDDGDLRFHFMEMNTRLQVEHPVTEAITGQDLVEWQLRVACGEPLPLRQDQLRMQGHAIEARLCAENPQAQFLPAIGTLDVLRWPEHVAFARNASGLSSDPPSSVRVDAGVREGDAISPHYDSMIAKLIVWGADREQALARMDAALRDTHILGLHTNVAFLRRTVTSASFAQADLDTALIEREQAHLFGPHSLPLEWAVAGVLAHTIESQAPSQGADPWSRLDGWRLSGFAQRHVEVRLEQIVHRVTLRRQRDGSMSLHLDAQTWPLRVQHLGHARHAVQLGAERRDLIVHASGPSFGIFAQQGSAELSLLDALAQGQDSASHPGGLTAPMPGRILALHAKPGDQVACGQALAVMEAMKMEHTIVAPQAGLVEACLCAVGDQVKEGAELLRMATIK